MQKKKQFVFRHIGRIALTIEIARTHRIQVGQNVSVHYVMLLYTCAYTLNLQSHSGVIFKNVYYY